MKNFLSDCDTEDGEFIKLNNRELLSYKKTLIGNQLVDHLI